MKKSLECFLLIAVMLVVVIPWQTRPVSGQNTSFSSPQILQQLPGSDDYPSVLQARNGTLWVAWQHYQYQAYYRTFNGALWSPVRSLPLGTTWNISPSMAQLNNRTIIFLWSSNQTGYWNLYYNTLTGNTWTSAKQLTSGPYNDFFPTTVVDRYSVFWLVWERSNSAKQIYYKTLNVNTWSPETQFTVDPTSNVTPSVTATKDGRIWATWSKLVSGQYDLFSRVYNGTAWSGDISLTNNNTWDLEPGIVQDRNGTIWMFWSRQIQLSNGSNPVFEQKLFYKFTTNLGQTWSSDTQLTFAGDVTNPIDDLAPVVVQGSNPNINGTIDHGLWIFFSSDLTGFGADFDIYYIRSSQIYPVHDVAVTAVGASPVKMFPWGLRVLNIATATLYAVVFDLGDFPETVTVTIQAANKTTFTLNTPSFVLGPGSSKAVGVSWNASTATPGWYAISASVAPVPGETMGDSGDNSLGTSRAIAILYPGDLNFNGKVDFLDASMFGAAWQTRPGLMNWNPDADINHNGVVDIFDASAFGSNWQ